MDTTTTIWNQMVVML